MSGPGAFWTAYRNYAVLAGRAGRAELIWFSLVLWAVGAAFSAAWIFGVLPRVASVICLGYLGISILPAIALGARRLHGLGRSAWWLLLLVPGPALYLYGADQIWQREWGKVLFIGGGALSIAMGVVACVAGLWPGQEGANRYGPDPRDPSPMQ